MKTEQLGRFLPVMVRTAAILALCVVILGAYTRLTHAGLGCPDWPGCYGHMVLPSHEVGLSNAQLAYPEQPIEQTKAWTEMVHRYLAGTLGLLILAIAAVAIRQRFRAKVFPLALPLLLVALVIFQAALGMWTVTLKLLPVVVMGHLLGGLTLFSSLWALNLSVGRAQLTSREHERLNVYQPWVVLGLVIVVMQVALGGWVSSNYAGLSCVGFPQCNGQWLPSLNLREGFDLFSPIGVNYQGGWLDSGARMTIQVVHRYGAFLTATYVLTLSSLLLFRAKISAMYPVALTAVLLVFTQFSLGVLNVIKQLPLSVAVAHNGVAALLLASMVTMSYRIVSKRTR